MTGRAVVILAVMVGTAFAVPTPHAALADRCTAIESTFGVTASGDAVEERYCAGGSGAFAEPRRIAERVHRMFWGGRLVDGAHVFYAVSPLGELWWYRQDTNTGRLGAGVRVGIRFGDWRAVEHPITTGDGDLYGVDRATGHLLRWVHYGWSSGVDVWDGGPLDIGAGCAKQRPVYTGRDGPALYVAVVAQPPSYAYCATGTVSLLPSDVDIDTVTAAPNHGVAYALMAGDHRLVRLTMNTNTNPPQWTVMARSTRSYAYTFVGRPDFLDDEPKKYEWQWAFYGEI